MVNKQRLSASALFVVLTLLLSQFSFAQQNYTNGVGGAGEVQENPSALAMTGDLLIVRPVMFGMTVLGSALWLVSLPFSAAGGNIKQAGDTLVVTPAKHTFVRCLGCTRSGYQRDVEGAAK